jgi:hypothetical protein
MQFRSLILESPDDTPVRRRRAFDAPALENAKPARRENHPG